MGLEFLTGYGGVGVLARLWLALEFSTGYGGGNYPDETKMWLAHWFGSDCPASAPGRGVSRQPSRDDSLSRLISAPAPGGGQDDLLEF